MNCHPGFDQEKTCPRFREPVGEWEDLVNNNETKREKQPAQRPCPLFDDKDGI